MNEKMHSWEMGAFFMAYIQGEGRDQGSLFPVDQVCRVIDAFVSGLAMEELGFERAEVADTGRPGSRST
jgi:hypothetical protein